MKSCVFQALVMCVLLGVCGCAEAITDERLASEVIETALPSWSQTSRGGRRSEAAEDCAKQAEALDNRDQYGDSAAERRWRQECENRYHCAHFDYERTQMYTNPYLQNYLQHWEEDAKREHVYYRTLFEGWARSCDLDVFPSDVTICNRRSQGDTIYYDASLRGNWSKESALPQLNSYACSFTCAARS